MKTQKEITPYLLELHYQRPLFNQMKKIKNSSDIDAYFRENISLKRIDHKEFFWIVLMTQSHGVLGISEISSGKTRSTTINFKELVQLVALSNASAVVLIHNHPSGRLQPSSSDEEITQKAQKVLRLIDVTLLDHLIITTEGYYSMVDHGSFTHVNY